MYRNCFDLEKLSESLQFILESPSNLSNYRHKGRGQTSVNNFHPRGKYVLCGDLYRLILNNVGLCRPSSDPRHYIGQKSSLICWIQRTERKLKEIFAKLSILVCQEDSSLSPLSLPTVSFTMLVTSISVLTLLTLHDTLYPQSSCILSCPPKLTIPSKPGLKMTEHNSSHNIKLFLVSNRILPNGWREYLTEKESLSNSISGWDLDEWQE